MDYIQSVLVSTCGIYRQIIAGMTSIQWRSKGWSNYDYERSLVSNYPEPILLKFDRILEFSGENICVKFYSNSSTIIGTTGLLSQ